MAVVVICGSPVASPRLVNDADRQSAQESGVSALARGKATVVKNKAATPTDLNSVMPSSRHRP
jgi:hypothetical protein